MHKCNYYEYDTFAQHKVSKVVDCFCMINLSAEERKANESYANVNESAVVKGQRTRVPALLNEISVCHDPGNQAAA